MSIRKIRVRRGRWAWQARVMINGQCRSELRPTYEAAKTAEADLRRAFQHEAAAAVTPGTLRDGLRGYVARLEARGKGVDSVEPALAAAGPGLLDHPAGSLIAENLFAFKRARDLGYAKEGAR